MAFTEKYVTVTGGGLHDGSSEANAWTLAEGIANYAAGDRVNVKAGTYTVSSEQIWSTNGTQYAPVHWRGYKSTIGDMDSTPTSQRVEGTDIPYFNNTAHRWRVDGDRICFSNISFKANYQYYATQCYGANHCSFFRCRMVNVSTSSTAVAFLTDSVFTSIDSCYLEVPTTGDKCLFLYYPTGANSLTNSIVKGGNYGVHIGNYLSISISNTLIHSQATSAVFITNQSRCELHNCVLYNSGSHLFDGGSTDGTNRSIIDSCVFSESGGYAVNQNSGSDNPYIVLTNNLYHDASFASGRLNNIVYDQNASVDSSSPFVDAAAGDFTLASSSNGHGKAFLFENAGPTSYGDVGAIQHADPSGGSATIHPLYAN